MRLLKHLIKPISWDEEFRIERDWYYIPDDSGDPPGDAGARYRDRLTGLLRAIAPGYTDGCNVLMRWGLEYRPKLYVESRNKGLQGIPDLLEFREPVELVAWLLPKIQVIRRWTGSPNYPKERTTRNARLVPLLSVVEEQDIWERVRQYLSVITIP